ncbi:MAG: hypothetical protein WAT39_12140 [Planctomycetota bacterium]
MMKLPLFCVAALLAAVAAPAQVRIEGRLGNMFRGSVAVGGRHHNHCPPATRHRVQGRGETVQEQVLIPGYWHDEHVPPTYGWIVDHCGRRHWGIVDAGGCRRVWVPARYETRCRQVWVSC